MREGKRERERERERERKSKEGRKEMERRMKALGCWEEGAMGKDHSLKKQCLH